MSVLEHFKNIAAIPHCSFDAVKLKDYLIDYAKSKGFSVECDKAENILCKKGNPKICLQSHYDMVCVGDAPNIKISETDGFLKAHNSTLGADNGIGIAIMMEAMKEFSDLECLFTANEEVGLLGANNLELAITSDALLNLDSECVDRVIIGCAASLMMDVNAKLTYKKPSKKYLYEAKTKGYKGGHSGIDIVKNIPSAISDLALFLYKNDAEIVSFSGGERTNSISVNARAVFYSDAKLSSTNDIEITELNFCEQNVIDNDILSRIASYKHGVWSYSNELGIVKTSVNLAIVKNENDSLKIELFARSDNTKDLDEILYKTKAHFMGYEVILKDSDEPWEPVPNKFTYLVLDTLKKYNPKAYMSSIHAGLECGVLKKIKPSLLCASIGPNILSPHSVDERCEISTIEIIKKTTFDLIKSYKGD